MMGVETDIHAALMARVETIPTALPMSLPGVPFTPPEGDYIRVTHRRNEAERKGLLGRDGMDHMGILYIDLFRRTGPNTWQATSDTIADDIAAHFPLDLRLTRGATRIIVYKTVLGDSEPDLGGTHFRVQIKVFYNTL